MVRYAGVDLVVDVVVGVHEGDVFVDAASLDVAAGGSFRLAADA
ncbi:MAG: hypothetical protein WKF33_11180 [Thermoleophilaceae bacterium]